jgi:hypothetical protein
MIIIYTTQFVVRKIFWKKKECKNEMRENKNTAQWFVKGTPPHSGYYINAE